MWQRLILGRNVAGEPGLCAKHVESQQGWAKCGRLLTNCSGCYTLASVHPHVRAPETYRASCTELGCQQQGWGCCLQGTQASCDITT